MKLIHKQQLKQRLNPTQFQNLSKVDSFMYKMGVKVGYRLALEQLNNGNSIIQPKVKAIYTRNNKDIKEITHIANYVINSVCKHFNIDKNNLLINSRFRKYVQPRSVIVNILRHVSKFSTPQIASAINRDHTTVLHHIKSKDNKDYCWKHNSDCWRVYDLVYNDLINYKQTA